ncbi:Ribosome assembly factor mrt4 [Yarrowia sp. C11]|nr:Ribosome assembly factor mrt4 [Yarrowia sp. E02]KAG5371298.1 Ribosome assembly factor mrt4 [Yarrowia sp. C11]
MPKSKRNKIIALTKVEKKTREDKEVIVDEIHNYLDEHKYCFVFSVEGMRNTFFKDLRTDWRGSRIFFGRTKIMAKALGKSEEDEYKAGLGALSEYMSGDVGLLLTDEEPQVVKDYFESFVREDYARAGQVSTVTFTIPAGVVHSTGGKIPAEDDVPVVHSMEPTLRSLGMPTQLKAGKVELFAPYEVCKTGQTLDSRQTRLLKHFGVTSSFFKVHTVAYYDSEKEEVKPFISA